VNPPEVDPARGEADRTPEPPRQAAREAPYAGMTVRPELAP
jgi:hypothetical protein